MHGTCVEISGYSTVHSESLTKLTNALTTCTACVHVCAPPLFSASPCVSVGVLFSQWPPSPVSPGHSSGDRCPGKVVTQITCTVYMILNDKTSLQCIPCIPVGTLCINISTGRIRLLCTFTASLFYMYMHSYAVQNMQCSTST